MNTKKARGKNEFSAKVEFASDLEEQIRRRAYDLYQQRGCEDGYDTDDWLRAEAELAREQSQPTARPVKKARGAVISTAKAPDKSVKKSRLPAPSKTFVD